MLYLCLWSWAVWCRMARVVWGINPGGIVVCGIVWFAVLGFMCAVFLRVVSSSLGLVRLRLLACGAWCIGI